MDPDQRKPNKNFDPAATSSPEPDPKLAANQTNEKHGKIKRAQDNPEKDVSRGSEPARHYRK